jgi:hypothetical protein
MIQNLVHAIRDSFGVEDVGIFQARITLKVQHHAQIVKEANQSPLACLIGDALIMTHLRVLGIRDVILLHPFQASFDGKPGGQQLIVNVFKSPDFLFP